MENKKISFDDAEVQIEKGKLDELWGRIVSNLETDKYKIIDDCVAAVMIMFYITVPIIYWVLAIIFYEEIERLNLIIG